jgi:hypothetical protein
VRVSDMRVIRPSCQGSRDGPSCSRGSGPCSDLGLTALAVVVPVRYVSPEEVGALLGALRTSRDRAIVLAMLLAGLRRCEVLGLRRQDINPGERTEQWTVVPLRLRATLERYVEQMRVSLRPSSMRHVERVLGEHALWLAAEARRWVRSPICPAGASSATSAIWPSARTPAASVRSSARSPRSSAPCGCASSGWASGRARTPRRGC